MEDHKTPEAPSYSFEEPDAELPYRIRSIDLVKQNPSLFRVYAYNPKAVFEISGGVETMLCATGGAFFANWYYAKSRALIPDTFYTAIFRRWTRGFLGFAVGGALGYLKFGDRQRLNNAYSAERLVRRYPEAKSIGTRDLWKLKHQKAQHEFYRWAA